MLSKRRARELPAELQLHILGFLSPEQATLVLRDQAYWKEKFNKHFPHALPSIDQQILSEMNWHLAFNQVYDYEYEGLPVDVKKIFSLIKENNTDDLKRFFELEHLNYSDSNGITVMRWAQKLKNQVLLNYIYERLVTTEFQANNQVDTTKTYKDKTLLHWAIMCFQPKAVLKSLLAQGADINATLAKGVTAIHLAARYNQVPALETLFEAGMNIDSPTTVQGMTPLYIAAYRGNIEAIRFLVLQGANPNVFGSNKKTPLYIASKNGYQEIVEYLLENAANPRLAADNHEAPLHVAAREGHCSIVEILLSHHRININATVTHDKTALHIAAEAGNQPLVNLLIKHGADVNAVSNKGATPLYYAAQGGYIKIVKALCSHPKIDIKHVRTNGVSALHIAAYKGHTAVIKYLVKKGLDVNSRCRQGRTPLYLAAQNNHVGSAKTLLAHDAAIDLAHLDGTTPVSIATQNNHIDIVRFLLRKKANPDLARNLDSINPLHHAAELGKTDLLILLLSKTRNINAISAGNATPLFLAALRGHVEAVKALLNNNANTYIRDQDGLTPLRIAKQFLVADRKNEYKDIISAIEIIDHLKLVNDSIKKPRIITVSFFGIKCKVGTDIYTLKEKEAAEALKRVIFKEEDASALADYKSELKEEELETIYSHFKNR